MTLSLVEYQIFVETVANSGWKIKVLLSKNLEDSEFYASSPKKDLLSWALIKTGHYYGNQVTNILNK